MPVYWVYITAWATPEGLVQFRDDIYNKDGLGPMPMAAMQQSPTTADDEAVDLSRTGLASTKAGDLAPPVSV